MSNNSFELKNPVTGTTSELPVRVGTIGPEVLDIANIYKDHGVFTFDPAFGVTASCESKITYIDGDAGSAAVPGLSGRASWPRRAPSWRWPTCC